MAKILLISANAVFAGDLKSQLERHPDWEVREEYDSDGVFDAAVVDDDAEKLRSLHEKLLQTPLFCCGREKPNCRKTKVSVSCASRFGWRR